MPIYEYKCDGCGKELEVMQRITDEPLRSCPSCGGVMQRLISNTSFILKGTGWYATDYARKGSSAPASGSSSESKSEKDSSSSSSKGTEN
ncbi:MAG: FmdB family zinc ribbon protein [Thermodesulfobacteriota bacterium]